LVWLKKHGIEKADKKADRETPQGLVESYVHQNGKVGVLVEVLCETDFVARTDEFKNLCHEVAMQIAAMNPKNVETLLKQEYIRDGSLTISELIKSAIGKLGENIVVKDFSRLEI
jgi:elongation factor Ts